MLAEIVLRGLTVLAVLIAGGNWLWVMSGRGKPRRGETPTAVAANDQLLRWGVGLLLLATVGAVLTGGSGYVAALLAATSLNGWAIERGRRNPQAAPHA